jgi:tRNA (guanine-N7-)-methyltransferase
LILGGVPWGAPFWFYGFFMNDEQQSVSTDEQAPSGRLTSQSIRSFVLRQGRMSDAQHRFLDEMMPKVGIPITARSPSTWPRSSGARRRRSWRSVLAWGRPSAAVIAQARPGEDFVGIEVHAPGVGGLCKLIEEGGITNLRIVQHDAVEVLRDMIPEGSLAGVHIYFPDPWPKKRHHKRRLVQGPFVKLIASRLAPGGYLHCATDWEEYAQQMLEVLSAEPMLANTAGALRPSPTIAPSPSSKTVASSSATGCGTWFSGGSEHGPQALAGRCVAAGGARPALSDRRWPAAGRPGSGSASPCCRSRGPGWCCWCRVWRWWEARPFRWCWPSWRRRTSRAEGCASSVGATDPALAVLPAILGGNQAGARLTLQYTFGSPGGRVLKRRCTQ